MKNVSSSNGNEKYPKLRFVGYENQSYQYKTVEDLFVNVSRRNSDGTNSNVITNSAEYGLIPQRDFFDKDIAVEGNTKNYYIIKSGDFVYNPRKSTTAPYGPFNCYQGKEKGIVSPLYTCLTPKCTEHTDYLLWYFKSPAWHSYIYHNGAQGGARHDRVGMTNNLMNGIPISLPCKEEQRKVVEFLSFINDRISLQHKLVENLKKYKRGVVRTLLDPKKNNRQDIIWTTNTIGNLGTFIKGAPLSKADISSFGTPFILYGELYTTYKEVVRNVVRKTQASVDSSYLSIIGDVVIPTSGESPEEISTASCVMIPNVILAGDLNIYRSSLIDGRIMSYLLNHIVNEQIARVAQGKSVVHVQASEIGKITVTYPDQNEQKRIAQILELIDKRIFVSEDVLDNMKDTKKALLQQLFI